MMESNTSYERILANPRQYFDNPVDVVETERLSRNEKLEILESWELDALELEKAEEENMAGGESSQLTEVRDAIDRLKG